MRYFILLNLLSAAICFNANGQCTVSIPSNAIVINNDTTLGMASSIYWVCSGDSLHGSGVDNIYFVEPGGVLDMSGINKIVYLKSGASIICSGLGDTIYYETGAIINCSGNHVDSLCAQLIFDYSNAPSNGCVLTGMDEQKPANVIAVYPNPSDNIAMIQYLSVRNFYIELLDAAGRVLLKEYNKSELDVTGLACGIYQLRIIAAGKIYFKDKLVIQR